MKFSGKHYKWNIPDGGTLGLEDKVDNFSCR